MGEITGRQVFAVTAGAFTVIIAVNLYMAYSAVSTFPGVEVANSYVASQQFEANRDAQAALGWQLAPDYRPGEGVVLRFTDAQGLPVQVQGLEVLLGRTTSSAEDQRPAFHREAGAYTAPVTLAPGKWMLHVKALAEDGTQFQQRLDLYVKG
ncbi:MAG: FixH family protein [Gemmobacter sp.]|uniref:FixH family protein n=1 Tax=Gemmobacter sp. TaxID=1898957 RepID=UPI001A5AF0F8|nr:FixH family protein [Gemmobacter sp.]MBL8563527.1 FixH family protein [Gemmobacter sp.]